MEWSDLGEKSGFVWLGEGEACLEQTGGEHRSLSHPPMPPACLFLPQAVALLGQGEERYLMRIWKALLLSPETSGMTRKKAKEHKCPALPRSLKDSLGHRGKVTAYPGTCPQLAMSRCFSNTLTDSCTGPSLSSCPAQQAVSAAHRLGDSSWCLL